MLKFQNVLFQATRNGLRVSDLVGDFNKFSEKYDDILAVLSFHYNI